MLRFSWAIVFCWVLWTGVAQAQLTPEMVRIQTETVASDPPATQPTVNVIVNTEGAPSTQPAEPDNLFESLSATRIAQIAQGKLKITLDDVKQPQFWLETIRDLVKAILIFVPRVIACFIFLFVFYLIYRGIRRLATRKMKDDNVDTSIRDMIGGLLKWTIMGFGVVIACNQLGIPIVAMLTGVSIIGLAVGFAAQETLANFIAGIVIFLDKPFKVGDWIEVDEQEGSVTRVTFRSTRFTNLDGDVVVLPNTAVLAHRIINKSTNPVTRVNVPIGIAYGESIDRAREALLATLDGDPRVQPRPAAEVVVRACADSSINLMLHFWIREERYEDAMVWEYLEKCKKALDAAGISIPFPHMQLLLEKTPALEMLSGANAKRG
ncbi:MAG TPA: mechanosensitive ion channel family protein [Tepidisphaeraceae bacterium]|jgi:small conductance mechanosensitive channel|nr:mechanosensitive ion channel family protein [Tepidisphaeraceae bacterium]